MAGSPYAIVPSAAVGTGLGNYTITYDNGSLTVTPAVLTVSITAANKVYDGTTAATVTNAVLNGVVGSDQVSLSGGTATFANQNVGNGKTVTDTGLSLTGADASNYELSSAPVTTTANITPASLTITANDQTEPFGGPMPPLTASYVGFVGGDTAASLSTPVQLVTTATTDSPAGAYPIIPFGASAIELHDQLCRRDDDGQPVHTAPEPTGTGCRRIRRDALPRDLGPRTRAIGITVLGDQAARRYLAATDLAAICAIRGASRLGGRGAGTHHPPTRRL